MPPASMHGHFLSLDLCEVASVLLMLLEGSLEVIFAQARLTVTRSSKIWKLTGRIFSSQSFGFHARFVLVRLCEL